MMNAYHLNSMESYTKLIEQAIQSPRKRAHLCLHENSTDVVQRIVIAMHSDSLVIPHRHMQSHQSELIIMLAGEADALLFDNKMTLTDRIPLKAKHNDVYAIAPTTWHSLVCMSETCIFLEIKGGPYDPSHAAEMATNTPAEATEAANEYLEKLRKLNIQGNLN